MTNTTWMFDARAIASAAVALCVATPGAAQVVEPVGWRWVTDSPARVTAADSTGDALWRFAQMPPGWHVTTRPAAAMFDPTRQSSGNYVVESTQILFPGTSQAGYGIFFGGRGLEGGNAATGSYVAFLARRDGQFSVERRAGGSATTIVPWTAHAAVKRQLGEETASNVLRAAVHVDSVRFSINGERVGAIARDDVPDGHFGFRIGADLNLHITTLDYTQRLAPTPSTRR